ncbi:MAG: hypothetical protein D6732_18145 [Methanobacteriota archaeon]|nr:MAG: hypothetical protein D6732_18145 [Euryarchaeota archaeon]
MSKPDSISIAKEVAASEDSPKISDELSASISSKKDFYPELKDFRMRGVRCDNHDLAVSIHLIGIAYVSSYVGMRAGDLIQWLNGACTIPEWVYQKVLNLVRKHFRRKKFGEDNGQ